MQFYRSENTANEIKPPITENIDGKQPNNDTTNNNKNSDIEKNGKKTIEQQGNCYW